MSWILLFTSCQVSGTDSLIDTKVKVVESQTEPIIVIPEMVDRSSVRVVGPSNSFNVTWDPVNNVNYGEVFYEVSIDSLSRNDSTVRQSHLLGTILPFVCR